MRNPPWQVKSHITLKWDLQVETIILMPLLKSYHKNVQSIFAEKNSFRGFDVTYGFDTHQQFYRKIENNRQICWTVSGVHFHFSLKSGFIPQELLLKKSFSRKNSAIFYPAIKSFARTCLMSKQVTMSDWQTDKLKTIRSGYTRGNQWCATQ